jgi:membrane-bound ClpP family serine protease
MNKISRFITGMLLIAFGLILLYFSIIEAYWVLIYSLPVLIIGFFILFNKNEDKIEQIKKRG